MPALKLSQERHNVDVELHAEWIGTPSQKDGLHAYVFR